ncbi:TPA: hypothetical protein V0W55_001449 [Streptococcus pneumoniae]|nr:hypothetical protein [Streptococcus pneumoniae]
MNTIERTRRLVKGCATHCFEVVDRTDEVSSKHVFEVVDETDEVSSKHTVRRRDVVCRDFRRVLAFHIVFQSLSC